MKTPFLAAALSTLPLLAIGCAEPLPTAEDESSLTAGGPSPTRPVGASDGPFHAYVATVGPLHFENTAIKLSSPVPPGPATEGGS